MKNKVDLFPVIKDRVNAVSKVSSPELNAALEYREVALNHFNHADPNDSQAIDIATKELLHAESGLNLALAKIRYLEGLALTVPLMADFTRRSA